MIAFFERIERKSRDVLDKSSAGETSAGLKRERKTPTSLPRRSEINIMTIWGNSSFHAIIELSLSHS
jgi:hypothetical protein